MFSSGVKFDEIIWMVDAILITGFYFIISAEFSEFIILKPWLEFSLTPALFRAFILMGCELI